MTPAKIVVRPAVSAGAKRGEARIQAALQLLWKRETMKSE